jgi:anti-sigma factor RsiW
MNCNEFRESIAERLDDELSAQQAQDFDTHEQVCPTCRSALHEWRQLTDMLRAGWPSVDPPAHGLFLSPQASGSWLDATRRWFGYASMALVATSLLLLVIFPPAIHVDRNRLAILFGAARATSPFNPGEVVTQEQVRASVEAAVREAVLERSADLQQAAQSAPTQADEEALSQLAVRLGMLEETQGSLWQSTAEQRVYLQSLWSKSQEQGSPAQEPPVQQR